MASFQKGEEQVRPPTVAATPRPDTRIVIVMIAPPATSTKARTRYLVGAAPAGAVLSKACGSLPQRRPQVHSVRGRALGGTLQINPQVHAIASTGRVDVAAEAIPTNSTPRPS